MKDFSFGLKPEQNTLNLFNWWNHQILSGLERAVLRSAKVDAPYSYENCFSEYCLSVIRNLQVSEY